MRFASLWAFLFLLPLIVAAVWVWTNGVRRRARVFTPSNSWVDQRPRFTLPSPFRLHFVLRTIALALMVIALARPQRVFEKQQRQVEAIDILLTLDLSRSMDALDFKPNRRVVALNTISKFIDKRPDDRIGLVLFSGDAYLAVPTTTDHDALRKAVFESNNDYMNDGTAIGQSLAVAVSHLKESTAKSRVVILVTDGDNNMGSVDPVTAAELARAYSIKIYTIGVGKKGRVPYPIKTRDVLGNEVQEYGWLTDSVNDELMEKIAERTGGRFFRAEANDVLEQIFNTIDKLEKTKVQSSSFVRYSELAWPWLLAAFLILLFEGLALNTRWRKLP